jgi:hypothetical protein
MQTQNSVYVIKHEDKNESGEVEVCALVDSLS